MRIALLTDVYRPGVNGIVRFVSLCRSILQEMGHQVYIFTWGPSTPEDEPNVIRTFGFPHPDPGYHFNFYYSRRALAVLRMMDVLHANQPLVSGWVALRYSRRYGIPLVLTLHSRYDMLIRSRLLVPLPVTRALLGAYLRGLLPHCDAITSPTPTVASFLAELGLQIPVEVIPVGVDFRKRSEKNLTRADIGLPSDRPVALFLGRLVAEKNVRYLMKALTHPALDQAYLLIVGDGPERPALEACARKNGLSGRVCFVGQVSLEEVPAYTALADFCVTASRIEMLPSAVLEALGAGLPVLGLDVPWLRAVIQDGYNGLLVPVDDLEAFVQAWARLMEDRDLRERLAAGARETAQEYDAHRMADRLVACYERVLCGNRTRMNAD
ncbi:MAG: glycosyltransferase [Anaerolineae bacterium]|nr:glycosyltransferase [Anaerolineae bacterium]